MDQRIYYVVRGSMMRVAVEPKETRLGELFQRHASDGVRLAYLITGDRPLAEDIVQEAFIRFSARLAHLRDPAGFDAYLRRTIVNLANAHFRRRKVERRHVQRQASLRELAVSESDLPERDSMWAALQTLAPRQRVAIVLRFYEDLSEAQTADVMNCRPGTVKSLVSRGMDRLRLVIADE
jgi:RNA polymerase sigma-70 factor (sigma-E family)